nr:immunoglobulin light chain junction region [Macaca mulatta]MOX16789.1 immunoglobulin light chain junction region [Macaca mulatta]MOX16850.1 immunoglobulin light chain junction region [Macaca mulatta]MOX17179.1 immunoglobulin light chain junction region [Macaca mulatta]MOX17910.1 immunoglobulin light chain junction region [Macaca mulatta]
DYYCAIGHSGGDYIF